MSYPDPRYLGSGGEVTATFRPADTAPDLPRPGGAASYLATGATTGGKFGLYRWDMGPEPGGAEAHFHRTITESFFVLDGTVKLYDGKEWLDGESRRLRVRPRGRAARVPQRVGAAGLTADPVRSRSAAGGLLRGPGGDRRGALEADPRGVVAFLEEHDNIYV